MSSPIPANDPLKIHLTRPWRVVIMLFLITSFFILAPALILYTSGFRYNRETGEFKTTGVISIDAEPQDADVFVNNTFVGNNQPLRLDGLVPGDYQIRISKPGYHDFNTVISLRSHETSYVKGVTLWEKSTTVLRQKITTDPVTEVGINPNAPSDYFFITKTQTTTTLHVVSDTENAPRTSSFHLPNTSNNLTLTCDQNKGHCAWWSEKEKKIKLISLDDTAVSLSFPSLGPTWQWSGNRSTLGFLETVNGIQAVNRDYVLSLIDYTTSGVWFVDNKNTLWSASSMLETKIGNDDIISVTLPNNATKIIDAEKSFALVKMSENIEVITGLDSIPNHETIRAQNSVHHESNGQWLIWSPWEIISVNDSNGQHGILYRSAEPMKQIIGLEPTGSLLIVHDKKIMAFNPGYFTTQELASFETIEAVAADEKSRTIIIAGTQNGVNGIYTLMY